MLFLFSLGLDSEMGWPVLKSYSSDFSVLLCRSSRETVTGPNPSYHVRALASFLTLQLSYLTFLKEKKKVENVISSMTVHYLFNTETLFSAKHGLVA